MIRDITYCGYDRCPLTKCERHLAQFQQIKDAKFCSVADFHSICVAYVTYAKFGEEAGNAAVERGETGEWIPKSSSCAEFTFE